jgi:hypothetical protein
MAKRSTETISGLKILSVAALAATAAAAKLAGAYFEGKAARARSEPTHPTPQKSPQPETEAEGSHEPDLQENQTPVARQSPSGTTPEVRDPYRAAIEDSASRAYTSWYDRITTRWS